jgi:hypothetical protein
MGESLRADPVTGHLLYSGPSGHLIYDCGVICVVPASGSWPPDQVVGLEFTGVEIFTGLIYTNDAHTHTVQTELTNADFNGIVFTVIPSANNVMVFTHDFAPKKVWTDGGSWDTNMQFSLSRIPSGGGPGSVWQVTALSLGGAIGFFVGRMPACTDDGNGVPVIPNEEIPGDWGLADLTAHTNGTLYGLHFGSGSFTKNGSVKVVLT